MITKGRYLTIRIGEDDKKRIKADAVKAKLSLTDYVLSKLNTSSEGSLNISVAPSNVPTIVPTEEKEDSNVRTKPDGVRTNTNICPFCNVNEIKSGFMCEECKKANKMT